MNFGFTQEQEQARDAVRRFLDARAPLASVRTLGGKVGARDDWRAAGELGWLGLLVPEAHGGVGLGWVDALVFLEETGRSLWPAPFVPHCLGQWLLAQGGSEAQKSAQLPAIARGDVVVVPALFDEPDVFGVDGVTLTARVEGGALVLDGVRRFVPEAAAADLFVVAFRPGPAGDVRFALVERGATGLEVTRQPTLDPTRSVGTLRFTGVRIAPDALLPHADGATLAALCDRGALAVTAEGVGAMEALVALTSGYARDRVQFGQPIGRFQGVKHRLAEMHVDVESVKSLVYYAAWCADHDAAALPRAVSLAKAYAAESFPRIGVDGVQLHGAIGFTDEYAAQLFLKRAKWLRPEYGDAEHHYERAHALRVRPPIRREA